MIRRPIHRYGNSRVIAILFYQLTVQTLPDRLEAQLIPPDTTQTALSCRVGRCEQGIRPCKMHSSYSTAVVVVRNIIVFICIHSGYTIVALKRKMH